MTSPSQIEAQAFARRTEKSAPCSLNGPKAAVKDATGFSVPDDINIHVLGDNATDWHLVLASAGRNLSDGEISGVAGRIGVDGVRNATGTPTW